MTRRSMLTAVIGLALMVLGTAQFIIYGFVPPFRMPAPLQIRAGLVLFAAAPTLLVLGLWFRHGSILPDRIRLEKLFLGAFTVLSLLMAYLVYGGIVPDAQFTVVYAALVGTAVGGLVGMAFALLVLYGGYILYIRATRTGMSSLHTIVRAGGRLAGLYLLAAGIHLIGLALGRYGIESIPVAVAAAIVWTLAIVRLRVFTVTSVIRVRTDRSPEEAFELFGPRHSVLTEVWERHGLEVLEETPDQVVLERPSGATVRMDQLIGDRPSVRKYRTTDGGVAASTKLIGFSAEDDGTVITIETVTDRRLALIDLPAVYTDTLFTALYLDTHGFEERGTTIRTGLGGPDRSF